MKSIVLLMMAMILIFSLVSCSGEKQQAENMEKTHQMEEKADMGVTLDMLTTNIDLACGMTLTNKTIADTAIFEGQLYGFCCEDCKAEFKKDPATMIAKLEK